MRRAARSLLSLWYWLAPLHLGVPALVYSCPPSARFRPLWPVSELRVPTIQIFHSTLGRFQDPLRV
ncbi:hypothetical protein LZ32DRAFT_605657 [Colletotrichum eremochloae]|nr:hypothetical protein LY78DRAFT_657035 [Colletotrichum sublineola]KAK2012208.1 hypothetical protein LZ32DRAFT_605657 [Colletotrichum eremochloae]